LKNNDFSCPNKNNKIFLSRKTNSNLICLCVWGWGVKVKLLPVSYFIASEMFVLGTPHLNLS